MVNRIYQNDNEAMQARRHQRRLRERRRRDAERREAERDLAGIITKEKFKKQQKLNSKDEEVSLFFDYLFLTNEL